MMIGFHIKFSIAMAGLLVAYLAGVAADAEFEGMPFLGPIVIYAIGLTVGIIVALL